MTSRQIKNIEGFGWGLVACMLAFYAAFMLVILTKMLTAVS